MSINHHIAAALASERQRDLLEASHRVQIHAQPAEAASPVTVSRPDGQTTSQSREEQPVRDGRIARGAFSR